MLLGYQGWPYGPKQSYLVSQASDSAALWPYIQFSVCFDEQKTKVFENTAGFRSILISWFLYPRPPGNDTLLITVMMEFNTPDSILRGTSNTTTVKSPDILQD